MQIIRKNPFEITILHKQKKHKQKQISGMENFNEKWSVEIYNLSKSEIRANLNQSIKNYRQFDDRSEKLNFLFSFHELSMKKQLN